MRSRLSGKNSAKQRIHTFRSCRARDSKGLERYPPGSIPVRFRQTEFGFQPLGQFVHLSNAVPAMLKEVGRPDSAFVPSELQVLGVCTTPKQPTRASARILPIAKGDLPRNECCDITLGTLKQTWRPGG